MQSTWRFLRTSNAESPNDSQFEGCTPRADCPSISVQWWHFSSPLLSVSLKQSKLRLNPEPKSTSSSLVDYSPWLRNRTCVAVSGIFILYIGNIPSVNNSGPKNRNGVHSWNVQSFSYWPLVSAPESLYLPESAIGFLERIFWQSSSNYYPGQRS